MSFNPCSGGSIALGVQPDGDSCGEEYQQRPCFNPCSGGSIALGRGEHHDRYDAGAAVSILVLVEVLPWVLSHRAWAWQAFRFNPCSGGSIALGHREVVRYLAVRIRFQSLFWWKYCPGRTADNGATGSPLWSVSILVLVEVLPWASDSGL